MHACSGQKVPNSGTKLAAMEEHGLPEEIIISYPAMLDRFSSDRIFSFFVKHYA